MIRTTTFQCYDDLLVLLPVDASCIATQEESADNDYGYYDDWSKGSASHDDVNKRTDADNYEYSNY